MDPWKDLRDHFLHKNIIRDGYGRFSKFKKYYASYVTINYATKDKLKTVVEEVLKCHFDENELLMVLKSS